jgi:hypothetical protein
MKNILMLLCVAIVASGCSTMTPARYSVSMDNNQALKHYEGAKIQLSSMSSPADYSSNCRMMGPIKASDGMTIPQFVQKAFNDEFKFAGIYSESGSVLTGILTKIEFSSMSGITGGWWDLGLTLASSNGRSMVIETRYPFESGFDGITACNQTAQALGPAVQDLIKSAVTNAQFAALVQ